MKPWAERFIVLRAKLYGHDTDGDDTDGGNDMSGGNNYSEGGDNADTMSALEVADEDYGLNNEASFDDKARMEPPYGASHASPLEFLQCHLI